MFDWLKHPILKRLLSSAIRAGLVAGGTLLLKTEIAQHAQLTPGELASLIDEAAPVLAALAWSAWEAAHADKRLEVALQMPAGKTKADLAKAMQVTD